MSLRFYSVLVFYCVAVWSAPSNGQPSIDLDCCYECTICEDEFQYDSPCQCDSDCDIYGDCCISASESQCTGQQAEPPDLQCISVNLLMVVVSSPPSVDVNGTFWMVATCPVFWTAGESEESERMKIASDCTGRTDLPPVSDEVTGIVYKNENCAVCNEVTNSVISWSYQLECPGPIALPPPGIPTDIEYFLGYCTSTSQFVPPGPELAPSPRPCYTNAATCLNRTDLEATTGATYSSEEYSELLSNCTQGPYSLVRPSCESLVLYRNQYCVRCNGFDGELDCFNTSDIIKACPNSTASGPQPEVVSFSLLLDIRGNGQVVITTGTVEITVNVTCEPNEVFDPVNDICRPTVCSEEGICMSLGNSTINSYCTSIALNASEYEDLGNNTILWNGNVEEVQGTFMGRPVVCVNFSSNGTRQENRTDNTTILFYSYPAGFVELTYIGGALSIIGCSLILVTYTIFKELRTLPSKILMNIAAAILVYIIFLLVGNPLGQLSLEFCTAVAIIIQLFVLAQFSWMSILLFEMARSFYNALKMAPELSEKTKTCLFLVYMIIGWSVPLIITMTTVAVNFTTDFVLYGETEDGTQGLCWINHPYSLIAAFIAPILVAYLLNIILFIVVSVFLFKAWRGQSKLKKDKNLPYMRVYLAVFAASGLTWLFGFIAILVGTDWSWYPFIILNSSQGFLIFIVFLCTKKIAKRYLSFFRCDVIAKSMLSKSTHTTKTGEESRNASKDDGNAIKLSTYSSQGLVLPQDCDATTSDSQPV